jgi:hypothetical protein
MNFLAAPDTNSVIVNTELTKIEVTVVINLEWYNLGYPCYPVGRPHVTSPATTRRNIPWVEYMFTTARIGRLYQLHFHTVNMVTVLHVPSHVANKALYTRNMGTRTQKPMIKETGMVTNYPNILQISSFTFGYGHIFVTRYSFTFRYGYVFVTRYKGFYFQINWLKDKVGKTTLYQIHSDNRYFVLHGCKT